MVVARRTSVSSLSIVRFWYNIISVSGFIVIAYVSCVFFPYSFSIVKNNKLWIQKLYEELFQNLFGWFSLSSEIITANGVADFLWLDITPKSNDISFWIHNEKGILPTSNISINIYDEFRLRIPAEKKLQSLHIKTLFGSCYCYCTQYREPYLLVFI